MTTKKKPKRTSFNNSAQSYHSLATRTRFDDLPIELHIMILKEYVAEYEATKKKPNTSQLSPKGIVAELTPLSLINSTWRALVQRKLFEYVTVVSEDVPEFVEVARRNKALLSYIQHLTVTTIAGDSLNYEATAVSDFVELKEPSLTLDDRTQAFKNTWEGLRDLLGLADGERLKLRSLKLSARDYQIGRFNCVGPPRFSFVPKKDSGIELLPLGCASSLKELALETDILEHLELRPRVVRSIIGMHKDIEVLRLTMSDIRASRPFRRNIYHGLVKTLTEITTTHNNLTELSLQYPSSTGQWDFHGRIYCAVYAHAQKGSDPLCTALRVLSQRLVKFHFSGRISSHLFTTPADEADPTWPHLKEFSIQIDAVDSFGGTVFSPTDDYWMDRGSCYGCCFGELWEAESGKDDSLRAVAQAVFSSLDKEEKDRFDVLMCEECSGWDYSQGRMEQQHDHFDTLFLAASKAVLQMPKIEMWRMRSVCRTFSFTYDKSENRASIEMWWKPPAESEAIWEERFPGFQRTVSREYYDEDMVRDHADDLVGWLTEDEDEELDEDEQDEDEQEQGQDEHEGNEVDDDSYEQFSLALL